MILAALTALALAAPVDEHDIDHATQQAAISHKHWRYVGTPGEARKHFLDAAKACEAIGPDDPRGLFCLYVSVSALESDFRLIAHDSGIGYGYIGSQRHEVYSSAKRLGYPCSTPQAREGAWRRFHQDRSFRVWVEVRHLARLVDEAEGDWRRGMKRHNGGKHYVGDLLNEWMNVWLESPPLFLVTR